MTTGGWWRVVRAGAGAGELHARDLPDPLERTVWVLEPTRPALVLGSTQRDLVPDEAACRARGVDVVRRRSGGGAVLLVPGDTVWVDVLLPRGDPLWVDDVSRSSRWLGRAWVDALAALGVEARVHAGSMACGRWGSLVCFAGTAPGEVVAPGGATSGSAAPVKLVGLSQRRTRAGARFQCLVHRRADPALAVELLGPAVAAADRAALRAHLEQVVGVVDVPGDRLVEAFVAALVAVLEGDSDR